MTVELLDREVRLEGSVNFRDLGGLQTTDGRIVRSGRLFRSDALHRLTSADLESIAHLTIATLIDLRSPKELERSGPSPLLERGARHIHMPIFTGDVTADEVREESTLEELYVKMLERGTDKFGLVFEILATGEDLPAVIHCAGGKDRTGVVTALVLRALGVPDPAIVADYAITDRNMARLIEQFRASGHPVSEMRVPDHYMRAVPETMETFLRTVDETYGSTTGYLAHAGIDGQVVSRLRDQLLEPMVGRSL
jgi:protein-tyrosine phosphatase